MRVEWPRRMTVLSISFSVQAIYPLFHRRDEQPKKCDKRSQALSDELTLILFASHAHVFFEQSHGHYPMVGQAQRHDQLSVALLADYMVPLD